MKIAVKNFDNQQVREIELPEEVFGYPYKEHLIHEAVQAYLLQFWGEAIARFQITAENTPPKKSRPKPK